MGTAPLRMIDICLHPRSVFILVFVVGLSATSVKGSQQSTTTAKFSFDRVLQAVVTVVALDEDGDTLSQGSGVFLADTGQLATNYHVIEGAHSAFVKSEIHGILPVVGVEQYSIARDVAILRIRGSGFHSLRIGKAPRVGERVLAVGTPLGLEQSVSEGIISGIRRDAGFEVLQTTAPISPGSSGGALVNEVGDLLGITTYTFASGQNLNFAIPADYVKQLASASFDSPVKLSVLWQREMRIEALPREWSTRDNSYQLSWIENELDLNFVGRAVNYRDEEYRHCRFTSIEGKWTGKCSEKTTKTCDGVAHNTRTFLFTGRASIRKISMRRISIELEQPVHRDCVTGEPVGREVHTLDFYAN